MSSLVGFNFTRIGRRIRELRIQNSLSHKELEDKTRLTEGYISRLEDGHDVPECGTLQVLAEALGVPLYRLFSAGKEQLETPRLTPRPTLDELVVEGCVPSKAGSVLGALYEIIVGRIETGLDKLLPSSPGQRQGNGPRLRQTKVAVGTPVTRRPPQV